MASLFRALATRRCTSVLRRSFALSAAKTTDTDAPAINQLDEVPNPGTPFETLRGVIDDNTLRAIKHTHMSPVQARIFPLLPDLALPYDPTLPATKDKPRDLLVKAKTGTGKTMGFLLPAIEARLKTITAHVESTLTDSSVTVTPQFKAKVINRYATDRVGTLIVSPTRELATQIAVEAANLTKHVGFQIRLLLGGESKHKQIKEWQGRKDIVVCTPGRILDLLETEPQFSAALKYTQVVRLLSPSCWKFSKLTVFKLAYSR
jgi:ATP-dependent RNA helicase MSS116, mitochondrial